MFARKAYISELPWEDIRREYETEGATIAQLQRKYHVASPTTLHRRRDREGWTRSVTETAAGMAPIVAAMGEVQDAEQPAPAQASVESTPAPETRQLAAPSAPKLEAEVVEAERVVVPTEEQLQEAMDQRAVGLINKLAQMQAARIKKQMEIAEEVQNVGLRILRTVSAIFEPTNGDAQREAEVTQAVIRLIRVNADRETLAGLVKAASDVVHKGITIERVALGMDIPARLAPGPVPEMPPSVADKPAIGLIQRLDYDTAKKVRDLAQEMKLERDRRRTQSAAA